MRPRLCAGPLLASGVLALTTMSGCPGSGDDGAEGPDESQDASASSSGSAGTASDPELASLIDHEQWVELDAAGDPLAEHRPDPVECGIAGWYLEDDGLELEVDTGQCNYLAVHQPSLRAIEAGQPIEISFYHFDLIAPEPAQGHLQISIDGEVLWDYLVEIPSDPELGKTPAAFVTESFDAPFSAPAGADVVFHVHNHGQNTWALRTLAAAQ